MKLTSPKGFTLTELLVSISIIGILFGIGVAKYQEFRRKQILQQAYLQLRSDLRLAQDKAISGEKNVATCGSSPLTGWYVTLSPTGYQLYGSCDGKQFSLKSVDFTNQYVNISPNSTIHFYPLGKGVEAGVVITLTAFGFTQQITVTTAGQIK